MKVSHIALSERKLLLRSFDLILIIATLWSSSYFLIQEYIEFDNQLITQWIIVYVAYFFLFGEIFQLYDLRTSSNRFRVVRSLFITVFMTTLAFVFTPYLTPSLPENRIQIIYTFVLVFLPVMLWRFAYIWILFSPKYFKDIMVIAHSSKMNSFLTLIKNIGTHNVVCYLSDKKDDEYGNFFDISSTNLYKLIKSTAAKEIVISKNGFSQEIISKINSDIITLFEEGINIKSYESFYEEITDRVPKEYLDHNFYNNINLSSNNEKKLYQFFRRLLDVFISIIGLTILLLVLPLIIIFNLFFNRGPIFYIQNRVGKKGEIFKIYKLRSMVVNAEKLGAQYATKNDKRITPFGKFLRNTRLDESPQFFNILKGDMSLIGPRPERPEFVKDLEVKISLYAIRHIVKPGLTGWAQVNFPYAGSIEDQEKKLRYDLFYIKKQNPYLDFKIIIKTITTVLFFRGQ